MSIAFAHNRLVHERHDGCVYIITPEQARQRGRALIAAAREAERFAKELPLEAVASRAEDREFWRLYTEAKVAAAAAGACRRCQQELALAAVATKGEKQPHEPKLCGRCARIICNRRGPE